MTVPLDLVIGLAILGAVCGFIAGCAVATWLLRRRPRWPRFDHDMPGMVPLSGAADRYFRHDFSDTPELQATRRIV